MHERLLERVIGGGTRDLRPEEPSAILEVVYLAMAADGRYGEEELEAFATLAKRVLGRQLETQEMSELLDEFAQALDRESLPGRLAATAGRLRTPAARSLAYKLAYAMCLSDLDTNQDEWDFDDALREALGMTPDRAESLADDVLEALDGDV